MRSYLDTARNILIMYLQSSDNPMALASLFDLQIEKDIDNIIVIKNYWR